MLRRVGLEGQATPGGLDGAERVLSAREGATEREVAKGITRVDLDGAPGEAGGLGETPALEENVGEVVVGLGGVGGEFDRAPELGLGEVEFPGLRQQKTEKIEGFEVGGLDGKVLAHGGDRGGEAAGAGKLEGSLEGRFHRVGMVTRRIVGVMAKKKDKTEERVMENRKARFDYHISETLECGIQLRGSEVKSIRDGKVSLTEGYVRVQENPPGLYLHSVTIDEYGPAGSRQHSMGRTRKLLAHKREIAKLWRQVQQKGMTLVPLKMYFKNGYAKVLIGLGKGKSKHDKRHSIAERESKRDISRAMTRRDRS